MTRSHRGYANTLAYKARCFVTFIYKRLRSTLTYLLTGTPVARSLIQLLAEEAFSTVYKPSAGALVFETRHMAAMPLASS